MQKVCDIIFLILAASLILGLGISIFVLPSKTFSEHENRPLATLPSFEVEGILSGKFAEKLGDFYADQLPLKDGFSALYALSELTLGKQEVNGVIISENSTLITRPSFDKSIYDYNTSAIQDFLAKNQNAMLFCAPDSAEVFSDRLSKSAKAMICDITALQNPEFLQKLSSSPEEFYYRTDHHWTAQGAYEAYLLICKALELTSYAEEFFVQTTVCEDFLGSAYRRSCLPSSAIKPDKITLYRYDTDEEYILTDHEKNTVTNGFYCFGELTSSDAYRVFLGGNSSHISIKKSTTEERPKLLLIKDSFANSLVPFLALHYDIEMIDPRYASASLIRELCELENFDATLILCSKNTLLTDRSYGKALQK